MIDEIRWANIKDALIRNLPTFTPALTTDEIKNILEGADEALAAVKKWGSFDTVAQERLLEAFAQRLLNRSWPDYGKKDDSFFEDLTIAFMAWRKTNVPTMTVELPDYRRMREGTVGDSMAELYDQLDKLVTFHDLALRAQVSYTLEFGEGSGSWEITIQSSAPSECLSMRVSPLLGGRLELAIEHLRKLLSPGR